MPEVVRSVEIQARPSEVWRWMASEEALRRWLGPELEIDLRVGGRYRLLGPDRQTWVSGVVLEILPEGGIALSWLEEGGDWVHPARLLIRLDATAGGTRVSLSHDGFAGIGTPDWPGTLEAYGRGADRHRLLEQLADLVVSGGA
jgi:uncharacterized protein YndB with AHSA1/START domain